MYLTMYPALLRSLIHVRSRVYLRDLHRLKSSSDAWKQVDRKEPTLRSLSLSLSISILILISISSDEQYR